MMESDMDEYVRLTDVCSQLRLSLKQNQEALDKLACSLVQSVKKCPQNPQRLRVKTVKTYRNLSNITECI